MNGIQQLAQFFNGQINKDQLSNEKLQLLLSKYREVFLTNLQAGDKVEGTLTLTQDGKYRLEVRPGVSIPVSLLTEADIGKLLSFLVESNKNGKVVLNKLPEDSLTGNLKETITSQWSLPTDKKMQGTIDEFMAKQLPLQKDTLLQTYHLSKEYHIPSQVVVNTLENLGLIPKSLGSEFAYFKENGLYPIQQGIKEIIENLETPKELNKVFTALLSNPPTEESKMVVVKLMNQLIEEKGISPLVGEQLKVALEKQMVSNNTSPMPLKEQQIESGLEPFLKYFEKYTSIFKDLVVKLYEQNTSVALKENGMAEKTGGFDVYNKLAHVINTLEELPLKESVKEYIQQIRQPVALLGTLNVSSEYYLFPVLHQEKLQDAEVYFFRPKKKNPKGKSDIYTVVALDLPALHHIEVHIHKKEMNLSILFQVANEVIKKQLKTQVPALQDAMSAMGYRVIQCTYQVGEKDKLVATSIRQDRERIVSHLDLKA